MEILSDGRDDIYLRCIGSGRLYAMSLTEAEDIGTELLETVRHVRESASAPESSGASDPVIDITPLSSSS
jgi:hypothetical protein